MDDRGRLRPMITDKNTRTAEAFLQDDNYDIIFDSEGNAINGTSIIDTRLSQVNDQESDANDYLNKAEEFLEEGMVLTHLLQTQTESTI